MSFANIRGTMRTMRFRLMLWNAAVVVLTALVTLICVREGVRLAILHEMDQILIEDVYEIEYDLADSKTNSSDIILDKQDAFSPRTQRLLDGLTRKARGHEHHGWFVELSSADGRVLWASDHAPASLPSIEKLADFKPLTHAGFRIVQNRQTSHGFSPLVVRVGASTDFLKRDMSRIDRLVAMAAGVVLLIAPAIGYALAGRATRPISDIIQTTAQLRPTQLSERLKLRNTGDELDQLAMTINGLLNRIADYLAQKRDFLSNSAHELRTPIAAIRSSVEVALNSERTKEEYEELLENVIEECASLEVLVNQLLLLSETEADRLKVVGQRVDLTAVVKRAAEMFEGVAESNQISIETDLQGEIYIEGNVHHLRHVVNNLIDNAIKFTPPQGSVSIRLQRHEKNSVTLIVQDTGVGISANDLPHIFERFYRADKARSREIRGTGLGLSICEAVVEAHGGRISAESEAGAGSTFTVVFDLKTLPTHQAQELNQAKQ